MNYKITNTKTNKIMMIASSKPRVISEFKRLSEHFIPDQNITDSLNFPGDFLEHNDFKIEVFLERE